VWAQTAWAPTGAGTEGDLGLRDLAGVHRLPALAPGEAAARRVSAILAIVGFAFTVFTFFGVNYLLSGLHSYG